MTMAIRGRFAALAATLLLCSPVVAGCSPSLASAPVHAAAPHEAVHRSLLDYVNPRIGTSGDGHVFPGASAPFGMVQWSPDTSAGGLSQPGGYAYGDRIITGFSVTHLSGAGCVAFGNLPIMPTVRPFRTAPQANGSPYSDRFLHADEHASPGSYDVRLASGIGVRLTATPRTGFGVFSFPRGMSGTVIVNAGGAAGGRLNTDGALDSRVNVTGRYEISGWTESGHFCNLGNHYRLYFDITFDRPFSSVIAWRGTTVKPGARASGGPRAGVALTFGHDRALKMKIGLSYASVDHARLNLRAENRGWNDAAIRAEAQARWLTMLGRIRVSGGSTADERIFYTALYHALLHPNVFSDTNGQYIGFDGRTHQARNRVQYANFSGWDIYRSEVQLLAWLMPREAGDMMQSLVADAQQQGWLPKWPVANAETGEMNGDSIDAVLANAYAFRRS